MGGGGSYTVEAAVIIPGPDMDDGSTCTGMDLVAVEVREEHEENR